jgi:hypothetical protein
MFLLVKSGRHFAITGIRPHLMRMGRKTIIWVIGGRGS